MKVLIQKLTLLIFSIILWSILSSCFIPKHGWGMGKDELIKNAWRIGLAKVTSKKDGTVYLVINKSLKGNCLGDTIKFFSFFSNRQDKISKHFNHHRNPLFWRFNGGRAKIPKGSCGPNFRFKKGQTYLLFPDCFGAYKSAEIIANQKKDKWLKYVKQKLKEGSN